MSAVLVALAAALLQVAAEAQTKATPQSDAGCLACHSQKNLNSESGRSVFADEAKHKAGAHSILGCTDCHTDIEEFPHPSRIAQVSCATCHADEAADLPKSAHSLLGANAGTNCHGTAHDAQSAAGLVPSYARSATPMK